MADYVTVAKASELAPGQLKHVELDDGTQICLANIGGRFYAVGGECPHQGGPLGEGELEGTEVTCPWHGGGLDVTTGQGTAPPIDGSVPTYDVQVDEDDIKVALSGEA